jgi:hypothetical protein
MTNLETRLWASAVHTAGEAGMTFTVPCSRNVQDLIRAGAGVMRRENRFAEADLDTADASLGILMGEMIRVTRAFGEKPAAERAIPLRETALVKAKELCPLWPFG